MRSNMLAVKNWLQKIQLPVRGSAKPYFILHHTDKVLYDFSSLLHGFNSHNLTPYIYLNNDNAYENLVTSEPYYLCREESKVIKENIAQIAKDLADTDVLIELGPGSKSSFNVKTLPIIENIPSLSKYISVDICKESAKNAAILAKKSKYSPSVSYIVDSFDSFTSLESKNKNKKHTFVFFGSTLGNFNDEELSRLLGNISSNMNIGDKILITLDTNQDKDSLKTAYDNKYIQALFLNSLIVVERKLNCGLDFNDISIHYNWNDETKEVEYYFVSSRDYDIKVDGVELPIKKDKKYFIVRSRKFDSFKLERIFSKYNLDLLKTYKDDNDRMVVFSFVKQC